MDNTDSGWKKIGLEVFGPQRSVGQIERYWSFMTPSGGGNLGGLSKRTLE